MLYLLTIIMLAAARLTWMFTHRALPVAAVVIAFVLVALAAGLIP